MAPKFLFKPVTGAQTTPESGSLNAKAAAYLKPFVIQLILFEAIAVYGFVISVWAHENLHLPFLLLTVIGFVKCYLSTRREVDLEVIVSTRRKV